MKVSIKVIPGARVSEVVGEMEDGTLKVRVHAPPEKGKANDELVRVLAKHYGVSKSDVEVVRGHTSRQKIVEIKNASQ
ncbi:YggU family protein [Candidatus Uhrbacteria bacterium]|nr:YggU family protein [Candidatus Uhrbacteria bacterium]